LAKSKEELEKEEKERKEAEEKAEKERKEKEEKVFKEVSEAVTAIRDKYDAIEKSSKTQETAQKEIKETIEKVTKALDQNEVRIKQIQSNISGTTEISPDYKALLDWMRTGKEIDLPETKVMKLSDATLGGYLTSPEISTELLKDVIEYSPIRPLARVRTTGKESIKIRKRTDVFAAQWTGEVSVKTETAGLAYGMEEIPTHELYAFVDISNWDLEDSDFNLESELRLEFGEQFGVAEGTGFVNGNAVKKPEGIMVNTSVSHVPSGDANLITADALRTLYFAPKSVYARSSRFIMSRATMLAISLLKTGEGVYLLGRLADTPVWNILGSPVVEAVDMAAIAAGTFPVVFGDFAKAYIIVDRIALAILRDPYSAATTNSVRFHARKRLGGQVIKPEAICKLEIALT